MDALVAELNLMGYRIALTAVSVVVAVWAPPRTSRLPRMRATGWTCLVVGLALAVAFYAWDAAHGRSAPFEYMAPLIAALLGVAALEETGRFRLARAWAATRGTTWRHGLQFLLTGARAIGWVLLVPALAAAVPWWLGLPPYMRSFGRFIVLYALSGVAFTLAGIGEAALRRRMEWREVANRPVGALILNIVLFIALCLTFVALDPADPWPAQASAAGMIAGLAAITWYATYRWTRCRMGLPPLEVPTVGWLWRRLVTGIRRRRFRPTFRLATEGPYVVVEGDVPHVPLEHLRIEVLPRRITITVVEPLDAYSPWGGWTGVAPLPRTVEPSEARATLARGRLRVRVPRKFGVDLWD